MQKEDNDTIVTNEDTEILNLPLYTERKADGIYRYRRRVPKPLVPRIGKGYLYRNLGKTKQEVVGKWPSAHAEIEEILTSAIEGESKAQELIRKKDHRATILHLVTQEYGTEAAQRLEVGAVDDTLEFALMDLADKLDGQYPKKTLACFMERFFQRGLIALQMCWITKLSLNKQDMAQQTIALRCASPNVRQTLLRRWAHIR
jgi:hypothetical protein